MLFFFFEDGGDTWILLSFLWGGYCNSKMFQIQILSFFSLTETDMGFLNPSPSIWIYIRARQCFLFRFYQCFTLFSFREADMSRGFNGLEDKMGGYLWIFEGCLSFICGSFMNYL